jgi:hypothetical protein
LDDEWYFSLPGHGHPVARLDWSPEGRRLAVYDSEGWLRVLDVATGKEVFALQVARGVPAWSPKGDRLALAAADGAVKILDAATGKQVAEVPRSHGSRAIAWAPDGRRIAAGSGDGKVPVYDAANGKEVYALTGHEGPVLAVGWSGNGRQLASGGTDGKVKVWDVQAGREEYTLTADAPVVALAWRPDGRQIIASRAPVTPKPGAARLDRANGSTLWDTGKREVVWSIPATASRSSDFTWSSDGRRLGLRLSGSSDAPWDSQLLDASSGYVLYRGGRHPTGRVFADRQLRQAVQLTATGLQRRGFVLDLRDGQVSRVLVPWLSTGARNRPKYEGIERVAWGAGRYNPGPGQHARQLAGPPPAPDGAAQPDARSL